ncbi:MAG: methyltransferase domain-containing protein [Candidatus Limnocylindria bacterium]
MTANPIAPIGDDLIAQDTLRESVRERYRAVIGKPTEVASDLYSADEIAGLPAKLVASALGVGNPGRWAGLRSGEVVIDLGSGGGIDTLIAARAVAPSGRAIGLDTLPEMLALAATNAAEAGIGNAKWVRGELESIPLPAASVDVVISNGVVNLSPRKGRALKEAFRVLRPGGRVSLADIVVDEDLPPEVLVDPDAWAG